MDNMPNAIVIVGLFALAMWTVIEGVEGNWVLWVLMLAIGLFMILTWRYLDSKKTNRHHELEMDKVAAEIWVMKRKAAHEEAQTTLTELRARDLELIMRNREKREMISSEDTGKEIEAKEGVS